MTSMSYDVISTPLFYKKEYILSRARLHYNILRVLERFPQLSTVYNYQHLYIYCPGYRERDLIVSFSFDFLSQAIISSLLFCKGHFTIYVV